MEFGSVQSVWRRAIRGLRSVLGGWGSEHCRLDLVNVESKLEEGRGAHQHHGICHPDLSRAQLGEDDVNRAAAGALW